MNLGTLFSEDRPQLSVINQIAGLWSAWKSVSEEVIYIFTMLRVTADDPPLMRLFHKSTEKNAPNVTST